MSRIEVGQRLQRIFDLRPGETAPLIFFFTHSLFVGLFVTLFFSAANVLFLARFEDGAWNYYSREELGIPQGYIPPRDRVSRSAAAAGGP